MSVMKEERAWWLAFGAESGSTAAVMLTEGNIDVAGVARRIVNGLMLAVWLVACLHAQDATYPAPKPSPPKIEGQIVLLPESVVETQWPHALKLMNAPQSVRLLNPGQCIRVGIYSTGDKRDEFIEKSRLSFRTQFAGHSDVHGLASPADFKKIKPEGGDFVAAALGAAGLKTPEAMKSMASLAVSADHWCVPADAADGIATVEVEVESPGGHQTLNPSSVQTPVQIESFETGSKKVFKDSKECGDFMQTYYRQPNAARLLPLLQFLIADQTEHSREGQVEIMSAFLVAAIKSDPVAAADFRTRIAAQSPLTRALGLMILSSAGYDVGVVLNGLSAEEQEKFLSLPPLQDPFDLTPTRDLFQHLDMMWATFEATGQYKPVQTIASALGWRADYEEFDKLRNTPNHPPATLTPSLVRGVTYMAAGWSLWSFQRNDPLVADYIEYLLASPETSEAVKSELKGLSSNPAFKRAGK